MAKHIGLLIDQSGSMTSAQQNVIDATNKYIDSLADQKKARLSIRTFAGGGLGNIGQKFTVISDATRPADTPKLTRDNYQPAGNTPLFDALGRLISHLDGLVGQKGTALVVIYTDGFENSSTEYNRTQIDAMVADRVKRGWDFLYLGANMDAWAGSSQIGLRHAGSTFNFQTTAAGTAATAGVLTDTTQNYLAGMSAKANATYRAVTYGDTITPDPPKKKAKKP